VATARHQRLRAGAVRKARGAGNGSGSTPAAASNSGGCSTSKYFGHRPAPVHEMTAPRGRSRLHQDVFGHPLDTIFRWAAKLLDFAGAPYGTERVASEPTVKSALFGLSAAALVPPRGTNRLAHVAQAISTAASTHDQPAQPATTLDLTVGPGVMCEARAGGLRLLGRKPARRNWDTSYHSFQPLPHPQHRLCGPWSAGWCWDVTAVEGVSGLMGR